MGWLLPTPKQPQANPRIEAEDLRGVSDDDLEELTDTQVGFVAMAAILNAIEVEDYVLIDELIRRGKRGLTEARLKVKAKR